MGNIVIARIQAAEETAQAFKRIHVVLTGIDQPHVVADVVGHVAAGFDANNAAGLGIHAGVDQLDKLLRLTCTVRAHDQSNHKKSLLCH